MTKTALKLKCVFSKCFHGPKREPKKPLNKGLQGDFVLFELDCIIFQIVENMPFLALIYRCNSMEYPLLLMRLQKMFSKMFSRKIDLKLVTYSEEQLPSLRICMMLHSLITVFHMLFKKSNLKNS